MSILAHVHDFTRPRTLLAGALGGVAGYEAFDQGVATPNGDRALLAVGLSGLVGLGALLAHDRLVARGEAAHAQASLELGRGFLVGPGVGAALALAPMVVPQVQRAFTDG